MRLKGPAREVLLEAVDKGYVAGVSRTLIDRLVEAGLLWIRVPGPGLYVAHPTPLGRARIRNMEATKLSKRRSRAAARRQE
jgi:hypothetical protein